MREEGGEGVREGGGRKRSLVVRRHCSHSMDDSEGPSSGVDLDSLQAMFCLEYTQLYLRMAHSARLQSNYAVATKYLKLTEAAITQVCSSWPSRYNCLPVETKHIRACIAGRQFSGWHLCSSIVVIIVIVLSICLRTPSCSWNGSTVLLG